MDEARYPRVTVNVHLEGTPKIRAQEHVRDDGTTWFSVQVNPNNGCVLDAVTFFCKTPDEVRVFIPDFRASYEPAWVDPEQVHRLVLSLIESDDVAWHALKKRIDGICRDCRENVMNHESEGPAGILCPQHFLDALREDAGDAEHDRVRDAR